MKLKKKQEREKLMKTRLNYIFYDPRNNYQNTDGISVKKVPKKKAIKRRDDKSRKTN